MLDSIQQDNLLEAWGGWIKAQDTVSPLKRELRNVADNYERSIIKECDDFRLWTAVYNLIEERLYELRRN